MKLFYFLNIILFCIIYINKSYPYSYDFKDNQEISSGKRHTCSLKMGEFFVWEITAAAKLEIKEFKIKCLLI